MKRKDYLTPAEVLEHRVWMETEGFTPEEIEDDLNDEIDFEEWVWFIARYNGRKEKEELEG